MQYNRSINKKKKRLLTIIQVLLFLILIAVFIYSFIRINEYESFTYIGEFIVGILLLVNCAKYYSYDQKVLDPQMFLAFLIIGISIFKFFQIR